MRAESQRKVNGSQAALKNIHSLKHDEKSSAGLPSQALTPAKSRFYPLESSDSQPWQHVRITWGSF